MDETRILMGVVGRAHGVRGLVRVHSYAENPADLARYGELEDDHGGRWTLHWRGPGIAELRDAAGRPLADRAAAAGLVHRRLYVARAALPAPDEDEFYLADLVGLEAVERPPESPERRLGTVTAVHDYGAGASLEIGTVGGALLVPFTRACVPEIALAERRLVVVPPAEVDAPEPVLAAAGARP